MAGMKFSEALDYQEEPFWFVGTPGCKEAQSFPQKWQTARSWRKRQLVTPLIQPLPKLPVQDQCPQKDHQQRPYQRALYAAVRFMQGKLFQNPANTDAIFGEILHESQQGRDHVSSHGEVEIDLAWMVTKNTPVNRPSETLCGSGEELLTGDAVWSGDEIIHTR